MKGKLFNCRIFWLISLSVGILLVLSPYTSEGKTDFPTKPIEILCGYGAGGSTDTTIRAIAKAAEKYLGQPIVVVNKPGGGTVISLHMAMDKKPDGYSLVTLSSSAAALTPHLRKVRYNPTRDFTPIMQYGQYAYGFIVKGDAPWNTFKEFVAYARKNPYSVTIGSASLAAQLVCLKRLAQQEGIKWTFVPFNSTKQGVISCLGGHVTAAAGDGTETPFVKAGKLKMLAVLMETRLQGFPNVPTLMDQGYNYAGVTMASIVGPKGIPDEVTAKLDNAFKKAMSDPGFLKIMENLNMNVKYRDSKELGAYLKKIYNENADVNEVLSLK